MFKQSPNWYNQKCMEKSEEKFNLILHVYVHVQYRSIVSTQSLASRSLKLEAQLSIFEFAYLKTPYFLILYPEFSRLEM